MRTRTRRSCALRLCGLLCHILCCAAHYYRDVIWDDLQSREATGTSQFKVWGCCIHKFTANANSQHTSSGANGHEDEEINHLSWLDRRKSTIRSAVSSLHSRRSSSTSNSRVVLHRAFAFTISYFLTWSFFFISACFNMANKDTPQAIWYLTYILGPLQGFFNLCVYLQPKVSKNKSRAGSNATWCQAVMEAIWYSGSGDQAPGRGGVRGGGPANREHQPREIANSQ